ncbi:MAG: hypothetical protein IKR17_10605 [Bacteroidales bacterium]|nr:hypothetical protein [Bacteroidales bacterium]
MKVQNDTVNVQGRSLAFSYTVGRAYAKLANCYFGGFGNPQTSGGANFLEQIVVYNEFYKQIKSVINESSVIY